MSDHRGVLTEAGTSTDGREMPAIVKADGSGLVAGVRMMGSTTGNFSGKRCGKVNELQFHVYTDGKPWSGKGLPPTTKPQQAKRGVKRELDSAPGTAVQPRRSPRLSPRRAVALAMPMAVFQCTNGAPPAHPSEPPPHMPLLYVSSTPM